MVGDLGQVFEGQSGYDGLPVYKISPIFSTPKKIKPYFLLMLTMLLIITHIVNVLFQQKCDSIKHSYQHMKLIIGVKVSFINRAKKRYLKFLQD